MLGWYKEEIIFWASNSIFIIMAAVLMYFFCSDNIVGSTVSQQIAIASIIAAVIVFIFYIISIMFGIEELEWSSVTTIFSLTPVIIMSFAYSGFFSSILLTIGHSLIAVHSSVAAIFILIGYYKVLSLILYIIIAIIITLFVAYIYCTYFADEDAIGELGIVEYPISWIVAILMAIFLF